MKRINNKDKGYKFMALAAFLFLLFSICYAEAAEYNATYTPGPIDPIATGQTKTVSVTVKNTGTQTWTPGVTFLSYHWYQGSTAFVWDGERTSLPKPVAPNDSITLSAKVTANVPVGSYTLKWDMLGPATWFSLKSPPVPTGNQSVEVMSSVVSAVKSIPRILATEKVTETSNFKALLTALTTPKITGIFTSPVSVLRPEESAVITGSWFGSKLGTVTITLPSGKKTNLVVRQWLNTLIWVEVTPITGEKDGTASIQVETAGKTASNKVNVSFEATRGELLFPNYLMKSNCAHSSFPSLGQDECMTSYWGDVTLNALHSSVIGVNNGQDTFWKETPLKNGWVFGGYWEITSTFDILKGVLEHNSRGGIPILSDPTTIKIPVNWSTPLFGWIAYVGNVYIIGPEGVPYQ